MLMKKLLVLSNLVTLSVLAAILFKSCSQPTQDENNKLLADQAQPTTKVVLDYYNDLSFKSMTIPQALILKNNYIKTHLPLLENGLGHENARHIYHNLDDLKNLVWYIEYYSKEAGKLLGKEISPKDLGINIHFGQYPDVDGLRKNFNQIEASEAKNFANRQTVFFVPTIKIDNKKFEFNPKLNYEEISKKKSDKIKPLKEHYGKSIILVDYDTNSPIPDFGNSEPPYSSQY